MNLCWSSLLKKSLIFIWEGSPGISYKLWDENTIDRRWWNITTQERKVWKLKSPFVIMEVWSWKFFLINNNMSFICCRFNRIHLAKIIFKIYVLYGQYIIVYLYVNANCFLSHWKQILYKFRFVRMSARRWAPIVPIGMPTIFCKTFPEKKTRKMLSTKSSSILMMSSQSTCFRNQNVLPQNMFLYGPIPNICNYGYR